MKTTVTKKEVETVIAELKAGTYFQNESFQFILRPTGEMFSYDCNKGTYKFYSNLEIFARAIVRFQKRGF